MSIFISSLVRGMEDMPRTAQWATSLHDPAVGVELIAFTHEEKYWNTLRQTLCTLSCPVSFHGPYIATEGTSAPGTEAHTFLMESYRRVFTLALRFGARHVVYHTTQRTFSSPAEADAVRAEADNNAAAILALGRQAGICALVENLPCPTGRVPLYSNAQYFDFFARFPKARSIIDIGHAHMMGLDLEQFLAQYSSRVHAYHFHNNDGTRDAHNSIFDGTFDYAAFAPLFRKYTPHADIVLEYEPHVNLSYGELEEHVDYLKKNFLAGV